MVKPVTKLNTYSIKALEDRGVTLEKIADLVTGLQKPYNDKITNELSLQYVEKVMRKREVQHTVITAITLDKMAEEKALDSPLQEIVERDESLFGVDETLALAIVNVYGSIGLTNFGYIDKLKPGIVGELDEAKNGSVNTFLDDIVGAIAAAAASSLAHAHPEMSSELLHSDNKNVDNEQAED